MSYIPKEWKNNELPALNALNLNHIETGIKEAHETIEQLKKYSEEEVAIGIEDNGSIRYRKILKGTTPTDDNTWTNIVELGTNLKIKNMYGSLGDYLPIPIFCSFEYFVAFQYQNGYLQAYVCGFKNMSFELTIEYTKNDE